MDHDKKNSLWLALQYSISLVLSLVGLKLNLLTFGASDFSIWILLLSIWGVGAVLDLGFGVSIVRFIAQNRDNEAAVNRIAATGLAVFLMLGLIIVGAGIGVTETLYISNPVLVPPDRKEVARIVQMFLALNFLSQYLSIFFRSVFEGANEFALPAKLNLASSIILFTLIVVAYALKLSLIHLGAFYCVAAGSQLAAYSVLVRRYFPLMRLHLRNAHYSTFREIFSFSLSVQATFLLGAMIDPVIKFFLGTYTQRTLIPPYEVARRFTTAVSGLFSSAFRNVFPKASILRTREEYKAFIEDQGIRVARLAIVFSGIFFGVLSFVFFGLIVGFYGFREGVLLFFILALAESVNLVGFILYVIIVAIGKAAFLTLLQVLNIMTICVFLFIGNALAGPSMAILGYYFGVVLVNIAMVLFLRRQSGFGIGRFLHSIGMYKLALLHVLIIATILCLKFNVGNWYGIQAAFCISCGVLFYRDARDMAGRGMMFFRSYVSAYNQ